MAGINKMPHDFRRTAARDLNRAGVPESVAMKITGHKTRSVYDRYNITSDKDLKEAAAKLEQHHKSGDRHNLGTIRKIKTQKGP